MDESKLDAARIIISSLFDKGHGKSIAVERMVQVFGVTEEEAGDLFNACMGAASDIYHHTKIHFADCSNCKFDDLPHPGAHCYMFSEYPGTRCGQFSKK